MSNRSTAYLQLGFSFLVDGCPAVSIKAPHPVLLPEDLTPLKMAALRLSVAPPPRGSNRVLRATRPLSKARASQPRSRQSPVHPSNKQTLKPC